MARENGILADKFNKCILDKPIPLSIYKDKKKKDVPRFRPRSLRDYMRIAVKYSDKKIPLDPFDETDYNKEALEDMLRHWITLGRLDDYIMEQIWREMQEGTAPWVIEENERNERMMEMQQGSNTWDDFWAEFLPPANPDPNSSNSDTWAEFFNEFGPLFTPVVSGEPVTEETANLPYAQPLNENENNENENNENENNENESSFSEDANEDYPAGLTEEEYQILVNEFGEEEVLRQFS